MIHRMARCLSSRFDNFDILGKIDGSLSKKSPTNLTSDLVAEELHSLRISRPRGATVPNQFCPEFAE